MTHLWHWELLVYACVVYKWRKKGIILCGKERENIKWIKDKLCQQLLVVYSFLLGAGLAATFWCLWKLLISPLIKSCNIQQIQEQWLMAASLGKYGPQTKPVDFQGKVLVDDYWKVFPNPRLSFCDLAGILCLDLSGTFFWYSSQLCCGTTCLGSPHTWSRPLLALTLEIAPGEGVIWFAQRSHSANRCSLWIFYPATSPEFRMS